MEATVSEEAAPKPTMTKRKRAIASDYVSGGADTGLEVASHIPDLGSSSSSSSSAPPAELPVQSEDAKKNWNRIIKKNFLSSSWSAKESVDIAAAAQAAGAKGGEVFAKQEGKWSNAARDMLRACLKGCDVPELYFFDCRVKDATGAIITINMPCMLPSEVLPHILKQATPEQRQNWRQHPTRHGDVLEFCNAFMCPPANTYPLGMHGDGVPFKAKMADSVEEFSWSFASDPSSPRVLFCIVPKSFCAGRDTYEDILAVFAADMKLLASGHYAGQRHDGKPWRSTDNARSSAHGPLPHNACLIELRGDWAYYNNVFGFPSWASTRMCWKCGATQQGQCSFRDTGANALWRSTRHTGEEFLLLQTASGVSNSVIFTSPGVKMRYVVIDWLHTVDLGVAQSICGNALFETLEFLEGSSLAAKALTLWNKLKLFYRLKRPPSQFEKLTLEMLRMPGKGPKLRGKAAETRYLVPFVQQLTMEFSHKSRHAAVVAEVAQHLSNLYMYLDALPFPAELAANECQQLCDKYLALSLEADARGLGKHWKMKPKLHLMQELLQYDCLRTGQSPRLFWTYMDESWGGIVASIAARRGGPKSAASVGLTVMQRYRAYIAND